MFWGPFFEKFEKQNLSKNAIFFSKKTRSRYYAGSYMGHYAEHIRAQCGALRWAYVGHYYNSQHTMGTPGTIPPTGVKIAWKSNLR
jgi:hypothetical protein